MFFISGFSFVIIGPLLIFDVERNGISDLRFSFVGSFGHFQASKSGVHKGGLNQPLVKSGFVATRISVRYGD